MAPAGGPGSAALGTRLARRIAATGPLPVSEYVAAALYDPDDGFYTSPTGGGAAGRDGGFLTAPEVGPLFGTVLARAIDRWWTELGRPEPFTVIDWGAGPGTLARSVLAADPRCATSGALRWVAVEVSARQRARHLDHRLVMSVAEVGQAVPAPVTGVVVANELLDNLPFDVVEATGTGWVELRVRTSGHGFELVAAPAAPELVAGLPEVPPGRRVPVQHRARQWVSAARAVISSGRVVAFDYGADTVELAGRAAMGWLRAHGGGGGWLDRPGSCDITTDVALDQIQADHPARVSSQAEFLCADGIAELVAEGRAGWRERAHVGDLEALAARSRVAESAALLDPAGMGRFRVLEWEVGPHVSPGRVDKVGSQIDPARENGATSTIDPDSHCSRCCPFRGYRASPRS